MVRRFLVASGQQGVNGNGVSSGDDVAGGMTGLTERSAAAPDSSDTVQVLKAGQICRPGRHAGS